ncbi:MAG TPA: acyl-CoA dehydrogenase family protein [Chitinophagaceae bacterium]|nr:acyl-CoA dehydrogenase family protein [Chitinophagaceae bacterium]
MESTQATTNTLKGGEFLVRETDPGTVFIPEDFSEEQRMILEMCETFIDTEITPVLDRIDQLEPGLMPSLLDKAGEQGLLGAPFPEKYGGLDKDFITATLINEGLGGGHSFSVAMAAHTGIGCLPLLYFGTEAQKDKYMSRLATGEMKASYALSEPNAGSDALSVRTTATLSEDGKHYLLNGQKCWITNSGFADLFTVFAKIGGEQFSAFLVEKGTPGMTLGQEEHKMGIKGSSTRQIFFEDCKVPVENLLGEAGKGHKIAFNILNIGRLKLCAAALGGAKKAATITIRYAATREQFGKPIADFGAIQYKLAEQAIRIFSTESALYRTAQLIGEWEKSMLEAGKPFQEAAMGSAEEYAVECAILKVAGSEALDYVVDEGVQVHGGNGFIDDYNISRAYRDSRINRIFEGTNEINRLLTLDMMVKRAFKGRLDLMTPVMEVQKELTSIPDSGGADNTPFGKERKHIGNLKKAILMTAGAAMQKLGNRLEQEQEIVMNISDMLIDVFLTESTLLRVIKLTEKAGAESTRLQTDILHVVATDATDHIYKLGKDAIAAFAQGDELRMLLMGLKRFTRPEPFNTKDARRRIAGKLIEENKYCF